ncbi:hypothetical protein Tco_0222588 [Tanacetum coccineum]
MESLNSNSQERELHQLQQMKDKSKESCMASFRLLHSLLQVLSNNDLKRPGSEGGFERAFVSLFDQDVQTFRDSMLLNLGKLQKQLDKDEFQEDRSMAALWYDSSMNERQMQSKEGKVDSSKALDASLVVTECSAIESENSNSEHAFNKSVNESSGKESRKKDTSSSLGNYITHVVDTDIRPANDQVSFAKVQLTVQHNVLANEQQHTEQSEPMYDTYLLKKVDSNTTPDSTNMSHRGEEIDYDAEQYQVKSPLLNVEFFKTKDMVEKEINELKAQLQAKNSTINNLKKQTKNVYEKSNEAKIKDHNDSLIAQVNSKTVENADLKAQIQEKVFTNATLKNELRKLKGNSVNTKFAKPSILWKAILQPLRNQSVVRQSTAF